jgi:hypothetical protein
LLLKRKISKQKEHKFTGSDGGATAVLLQLCKFPPAIYYFDTENLPKLYQGHLNFNILTNSILPEEVLYFVTAKGNF